MRNNTTRAVLLVAAIALIGIFAGSAMAATAPSVNSNSDISDGATVSITNASSDTVSTLNVTTPTSENADVEVEITLDDRDLTVYEAGDGSSDYTLVEENNANSNDVHEWNISHDEFADVPVLANESVTLNYTVTSEADDGTVANTSGTFTLDNGIQRSVIVLDQSALDGNVGGLSVSEDEQSSIWNDIPVIGTNASTAYDAESEGVPINGSNTTVHVYMQDSNVADEFDSASDAGILSGTLRGWMSSLETPGVSSLGSSLAPDVSAESGDRTFGMTAAADGEAVPVFIDSADSDVVSENDTYAVYNTDSASVEFHPGEGEYANASSMDVRSASMEPEDVLGIDAFSDAMTSDLSNREFMEAFGAGAFVSNALGGLSILTFGLIGLRRRDVQGA